MADDHSADSVRAPQATEALRKITAALKGFIDWHGGAHEDDCPEDDTCDCVGKPYNDAVNVAIQEADAALSDSVRASK